MATRVEIVPYDPRWPDDFRVIAAFLRQRLGACAAAVDHVGSTDVPGLAAKPVIDVDVTLRRSADMVPASALLVEAGYEPCGNHRYDNEVHAFLRHFPLPQARVYLCPPGNETHRRRIAFRDRLRTCGRTAQAYARLKRDLAERYRFDGDDYTAAKRIFIEEALRRTP